MLDITLVGQIVVIEFTELDLRRVGRAVFEREKPSAEASSVDLLDRSFPLLKRLEPAFSEVSLRSLCDADRRVPGTLNARGRFHVNVARSRTLHFGGALHRRDDPLCE